MQVLKSQEFPGKWRVVYAGRTITDNHASPREAFDASLEWALTR